MTIWETLATMDILHTAITIFFYFLILCMIVRMILSFMTMLSPANRFVRFFNQITGPMYDPIYKLMPRMSVGMFDLGATVAFIFVWWALYILMAVTLSALPILW